MSSSTSSSVSPSSPIFNPGQSPNLFFARPRAPSPYMKSLLTYIDAVNNRDYEAMDSVFDDALEHRILPKSLERPVLTKKQYGDYWRGVMALFSRFETKVIEVIEAGDKMTVHASSKGTSLSGTQYSNEYVLMIHFASGCPGARAQSPSSTNQSYELPKIRFLKEFVDSGFNARFFKEERERQRRQRLREQEVEEMGLSPR